MIQQQIHGKSLWETAQRMYRRHGVRAYYNAAAPTAIREGAFTAAYLGGAPWMKERLESYGINPWIAQVAVGITAGTAAAVISHPADTLKTQRQANLSGKVPIRAVFQKEAFAGMGWRIAMIATATTVIPFVRQKVNSWMSRYRN
ncbi:MAG: hypothetical protein S4CHLAM2_14870 [Chlamydiales bacterium]|nr:hypothetical protein [Chlamydiales bacterium]